MHRNAIITYIANKNWQISPTIQKGSQKPLFIWVLIFYHVHTYAVVFDQFKVQYLCVLQYIYYI